MHYKRLDDSFHKHIVYTELAVFPVILKFSQPSAI